MGDQIHFAATMSEEEFVRAANFAFSEQPIAALTLLREASVMFFSLQSQTFTHKFSELEAEAIFDKIRVAALEINQTAHKQFLNNPQILWHTARFNDRAGLYEMALQHIDALLELEPEHTKALARKAEIYQTLHHIFPSTSNIKNAFDIALQARHLAIDLKDRLYTQKLAENLSVEFNVTLRTLGNTSEQNANFLSELPPKVIKEEPLLH